MSDAELSRIEDVNMNGESIAEAVVHSSWGWCCEEESHGVKDGVHDANAGEVLVQPSWDELMMQDENDVVSYNLQNSAQMVLVQDHMSP